MDKSIFNDNINIKNLPNINITDIILLSSLMKYKTTFEILNNINKNIILNGTIIYKILYPSDTPFFDIDDTLEQMVLLNSDSVQYIDLVYLEATIPKNAFVYFVNKTASPIYFYRGNITNRQNTLAQNQIARASILTAGSSKGIKIDILNNAYSHFEFKIDPAQHLANAINILNLDFCGTEITIPPVSNFNNKDLFLICKNG